MGKSAIALTLQLVSSPLLIGQAEATPAPEIKLITSQTGIHRVTAAALAPLLGVSSNAVSALISQGAFTLLNQGQPVGWLAASNGAELLFHAQALHNVYTDYNVYWLVAGTNMPPARVDGGAPAAQTNEYYPATTNIEQDLVCRYDLGTNPDSNYWYWVTLFAGSHSFGQLSTSFVLNELASTNMTAQLNLRVYGATTANHTVSLSLNGLMSAAWTNAWYGEGATNFSFPLPPASLHTGTNELTITAVGSGDQWLVNGFQIQYPALYWAANGSLVCAANSNAVVTLGGFSDSQLTVLDVTQPLTPLLLTNLNFESVAGTWQVSFASLQPTCVYSACQAGSELDVVGMEAVSPVGLASPTNRAACIILAPTNFLAASQPLVDYRRGQGLETMLVSLESVYNEFNYGLAEPVAISNFLVYAWQQWTVPPAYVLFMGNGTFDYRNELGYGDNYVPPLMIPSLYGLVASDSQYGQVTAPPGPQIAVGRLPVTSTAQIAQMISKITAYESAPPRSGTAVLLADLTDPAAGDFQAGMGLVDSILAGSYTIEEILPSNTSSNTLTMRNLLLGALNTGSDLFCYYGHGASEQLGDFGYLTTDDVPTLTETNFLPLVSAMTCLCGFFAEPGYVGLAQALALAPQQGAIATLSASGYSLDAEASSLNQELMTALISGAPGRLGDFIRQAMLNYNQVSHFTPSGMYNLLGDPALLYRPAPAPPAVRPWLSALRPNSDGTFTLTLSAQPSETYTLLASTNLALCPPAWTVISTGIVPFGPFNVTDPATTNLPQRYYRLVTQSQ